MASLVIPTTGLVDHVPVPTYVFVQLNNHHNDKLKSSIGECKKSICGWLMLIVVGIFSPYITKIKEHIFFNVWVYCEEVPPPPQKMLPYQTKEWYLQIIIGPFQD